MRAEMTERVRLGELLVETGLISREQLERALTLQKSDRRRLGEIVVLEGMVSEAKVTQVLSQQLSVPWVSLEYVDFSRQLLNLVQSETAEKHTLVPIYVRRSKNRRETLYVAIEDPSNQEALEEVADFAGLPVRPMIAPPSDIRNAIRAYYLGLPPATLQASESAPVARPSTRPEASPAVQTSEAAQTAQTSEATPANEAAPVPPDRGADAIDSADLAVQAPDDEEVPESVELTPRDSAMPTPEKQQAGAPRMITLTLLDGTQVKLPASPKAQNLSAPGELTARDLVEALRAAADGADVSEVLGENANWQRMFAALLSLMLKKHLVLDWEFVRELKS